FPQRPHGMLAGRHAIQRSHAGRQHFKVATPLDGVTEQAFRHWASTNVACANEKDGFHCELNGVQSWAWSRKTSTAKYTCSENLRKIRTENHDAPPFRTSNFGLRTSTLSK